MKFSKVDLSVVSLGIVIIATFSFLFYHDINKKEKVGNQKIVGKVSFKERAAERKYAAQVVWEDIDKNQSVYNNDTIKTSENSTAIITLNDQTEITLNANSMIMLSFDNDNINIQFGGGTISAKRKSIKGKKIKKLNIKSGDTTVSIRDSDLKVSKNKKEDINITLNKGDALIKKGKIKKKIKENEKVVLKKDSKDFKIEKQNIILSAPEDNLVFLSQKRIENISFTWNKLKNNPRTFIEISKSRTFKKNIILKKVNKNFYTTRIKSGSYFWRVRIKENRRNEYSDIRKFNFIYQPPVTIISPKNNKLLSFRNDKPVINFRWSVAKYASAYNLLIAEDKNFKNIVVKDKTNNNFLTLDNLKEGKYFFKVLLKADIKSLSKNISSKIRKFTITRKKIISPPVLLVPPSNKKISSVVVSKKAIVFTWNKGAEIYKSLFQISIDPNFNSILFSKETRMNFVKLRKKLSNTTYFWRVKGIYQDGEDVGFSNVRRFSIIKNEPIQLLEPGNNSTVLLNAMTKTGLKFIWKRRSFSFKYKVQFAKNKNFRRIFSTILTDNYEINKNFAKTGRFYWRVVEVDGKKIITKSEIFSFLLQKNLLPPKIIKPYNNSIVDMTKRNSLSFTWRRNPNVIKYILRVFHKTKDGDKKIFETTTNRNYFSFNKLNLLDVGNFYWTLQSVASINRKIKKSPVNKSSFRIILKQSIEKPDLSTMKIDAL